MQNRNHLYNAIGTLAFKTSVDTDINRTARFFQIVPRKLTSKTKDVILGKLMTDYEIGQLLGGN